jgi:GT2 family glycosyltransferase
MTDISVCVAVYQPRPAPNAATLAEQLPAALGRLSGELRVALNGISAETAGVGEHAVAASFAVNRGVSVAWNAAAAEAQGAVLCFCNDDVALGSGSLERLHDALARRPDAGVVGPTGAHWDMGRLRYGDWLSTAGLKPGELRRCDVVGGYLFALRRETFEAVGGFDDAYTPCGMEEVDLSTAVRRRLGLESYVVGGVDHAHEYGISAARPWRRIEFDGRSERLSSIHHRNKRHFAAKWETRMPRFDRARFAAEIARLAINRRLARTR